MTDPIVVDGYRDFTLIAGGPRSAVYLAQETVGLRWVAFKVWSAAVQEHDRDSLGREWRDAIMVSDHPNIVSILDAGFTAENRPFIVWDFIDGSSVATRIAHGERFDADEVLATGVKLASALAAVHRAGLLHGSVNPSNLFTSPDGEPCLAELGSWAMQSRIGEPTPTGPADPFDAQPSGAHASVASDAYSLCATLAELLAGGELPEPGGNLTSSDVPVGSVPPRRQRYLPEPIEAILRRGLAEQPAERYQTLAELGRDLQEARRAMGLPPLDVGVNEPPLTDSAEVDHAADPSGGPLSSWQDEGSATDRRPRRLPRRVLVAAGITAALVALAAALVPAGHSRRPNRNSDEVSAPTSPPASTPPAAAEPAGRPRVLNSVSCLTPTFCVAVDNQGGALVYDGSRWSRPDSTESSLDSVSCPTTTFCVAADGSRAGSVLFYNGTTWSQPEVIDRDGLGIVTVSCPTTTFCAAADALYGDVFLFDGKTWSQPMSFSEGVGFLSCPTTSFCAAAEDNGGGFMFYNGTSWIEPNATYPDIGVISCPTTSLCVGADGSGNAFLFNGKTWSQPDTVDPNEGLLDISCPSTSFCAVTDQLGRVLLFNGITWSQPETVDASGSGIQAVSCPTAAFCVAVGDDGTAVTYRDGTWNQPETIDPPQ
jgi:serine/threonine protein kinase/uncharacterized Fe-S cluster protein YjdI